MFTLFPDPSLLAKCLPPLLSKFKINNQRSVSKYYYCISNYSSRYNKENKVSWQVQK